MNKVTTPFNCSVKIFALCHRPGTQQAYHGPGFADKKVADLDNKNPSKYRKSVQAEQKIGGGDPEELTVIPASAGVTVLRADPQ